MIENEMIKHGFTKGMILRGEDMHGDHQLFKVVDIPGVRTVPVQPAYKYKQADGSFKLDTPGGNIHMAEINRYGDLKLASWGMVLVEHR